MFCLVVLQILHTVLLCIVTFRCGKISQALMCQNHIIFQGGPSSISKENEVYSDPPHLQAAEVHAPPKSNMNSSPETRPLEPKSGPSGTYTYVNSKNY